MIDGTIHASDVNRLELIRTLRKEQGIPIHDLVNEYERFADIAHWTTSSTSGGDGERCEDLCEDLCEGPPPRPTGERPTEQRTRAERTRSEVCEKLGIVYRPKAGLAASVHLAAREFCVHRGLVYESSNFRLNSNDGWGKLLAHINGSGRPVASIEADRAARVIIWRRAACVLQKLWRVLLRQDK